MKRKLLLALVCSLVMLTACQQSQPHYVIGVSQCSQDIWRDKLNRELKMGGYFHKDVELMFASADDNDERQIAQIDSFVKSGIDLLIVAPNQAATVSPAIDRAFDMGIPVIVFDRKTTSEKFTAYIGADNEEMGRTMGHYIAQQLNEKGRVLEIMGLKGSSPAIERHNGFAEAINNYPDMQLVASLQGDWTEESAYEATCEWIKANPNTPVSFVFGQNDRMAMGARRAFMQYRRTLTQENLPLYCGIDGLPGKGGGIECVRDSLLSASCIYPTHGDEVLQLALNILNGEPYEKENPLATALVTLGNAHALQMETDEIIRRSDYLERLNNMAVEYLQQLSVQRTANWLAFGIIVLLLVILVLLYLYHRGKANIRRERVVNNLWNLDKPANAATVEEENKDEKQNETAVTQEAATEESATENNGDAETIGSSIFITRFKEVVEAKLNDSELSVEDLAADMNLSRVQLYRKVKTITGSSPVELLRTARLNRGYQLLITTDKTISEVAYAVGFTAPSYFTKCFKEEFGQSPSNLTHSS